MCVCECMLVCVCVYLLWQGSSYDGVDLSVNVKLGEAPTLSVVGYTDGDRLYVLGYRNCDFKEL